MQTEDASLMNATSLVVSGYLSRNAASAEEIPQIVAQVADSLSRLRGQSLAGAARVTALTPAVPIEESVRGDYIVCLEDGKKLKMLKRHLRAKYNLSPEQYRERWGLPSDYPMVAPNYAERRRELAQGGPLPQMNGRMASA